MAENLRNPAYAAAHAVGRPFSNLALNVWSLRETKEMTQQQLAEAAKMKQPRIADIERDECNPTLLTISRIAFALGVTASDLLAEPADFIGMTIEAAFAPLADWSEADWYPWLRERYAFLTASGWTVPAACRRPW